jgi:hypothetical protein
LGVIGVAETSVLDQRQFKERKHGTEFTQTYYRCTEAYKYLARTTTRLPKDDVEAMASKLGVCRVTFWTPSHMALSSTALAQTLALERHSLCTAALRGA